MSEPVQLVEILDSPTIPFEGKPYYAVEHEGAFHYIYVDLFPCYRHDFRTVVDMFARCQIQAPLPIPLKLAILSHEGECRCNGTYYDHVHYRDEEPYPIGVIVLHGKRIPLHPAMTRYLVAHEYGHAVSYHLARLRLYDNVSALERAYIENCRPDARDGYGARKWHQNVGELMANDFRMLVMQTEQEFWPHTGFPVPFELPHVIQFWADAIEELKK